MNRTTLISSLTLILALSAPTAYGWQLVGDVTKLANPDNRTMSRSSIAVSQPAAMYQPEGKASTRYEWRDPATGKLKAGDQPPGEGVKYWIEGQLRPEEIAEKEKREAPAKAALEKWKAEHCGNGSIPKIGMDKETVYECFPNYQTGDVNITENAFGTQEQWVIPHRFGEAKYLYFTNGIITTIQR